MTRHPDARGASDEGRNAGPWQAVATTEPVADAALGGRRAPGRRDRDRRAAGRQALGRTGQLLADDQTLVRAAFAMLVGSDPDMEAVGQAATGLEAVAPARSERADLLAAIKSVAAGEALLSPGPTARPIARVLGAPRARSAPGGPEVLSDRERQVLGLVARGLNNAETLGLGPLTAKTHVSRIMGRLGARDRAQLVIIAYESGLVVAAGGQVDGN